MIRVDVIETAEPDVTAIDELKIYAGVSNPLQERMLMSALKRAFMMVQMFADKCMLAGRYRVKADEHSGIVRVYMGGKATQVLNSKGMPVQFEQKGCNVYVGTEDYVEVEFTTLPDAAQYDALFPVVMKYATGIYDGLSTGELNQILKEC